MDLPLEQILEIEDDWERCKHLVEHARLKVSEFPDQATSLERAISYAEDISLQAKGGDWYGSIFYDPSSKKWQGFLQALELLGYHNERKKLIRANEIYWTPEREAFDWDDPLIEEVESFGPQGEEASELKQLETETWDFVAELVYEVHHLIQDCEDQFEPAPNRSEQGGGEQAATRAKSK